MYCVNSGAITMAKICKPLQWSHFGIKLVGQRCKIYKILAAKLSAKKFKKELAANSLLHTWGADIPGHVQWLLTIDCYGVMLHEHRDQSGWLIPRACWFRHLSLYCDMLMLNGMSLYKRSWVTSSRGTRGFLCSHFPDTNPKFRLAGAAH